MMAGRKGQHNPGRPVPTVLKLLRGSRRPINPAEPKLAPKLPPPPRELSDEAKRVWRREGKMLLSVGVITALDVAAFAAYCVDGALMAHVASDGIVLHCLPAHRGEEITGDVLDGPRSLAWVQAENRLHIGKAILEYVMGALG